MQTSRARAAFVPPRIGRWEQQNRGESTNLHMQGQNIRLHGSAGFQKKNAANANLHLWHSSFFTVFQKSVLLLLRFAIIEAQKQKGRTKTMNKTGKIAAGRSYRLLSILISLTLLFTLILYLRVGTNAALAALLYSTAGFLPLSLLATSLFELRELACAREASRLHEKKSQSV